MLALCFRNYFPSFSCPVLFRKDWSCFNSCVTNVTFNLPTYTIIFTEFLPPLGLLYVLSKKSKIFCSLKAIRPLLHHTARKMTLIAALPNLVVNKNSPQSCSPKTIDLPSDFIFARHCVTIGIRTYYLIQ